MLHILSTSFALNNMVSSLFSVADDNMFFMIKDITLVVPLVGGDLDLGTGGWGVIFSDNTLRKKYPPRYS